MRERQRLGPVSNPLQGARRAAATHDLSVTQLRVLARLFAGPPPEALTSELARELDVSGPTVSDALAALRRKGLVERSADPADRRRQLLRLTARRCCPCCSMSWRGWTRRG